MKKYLNSTSVSEDGMPETKFLGSTGSRKNVFPLLQTRETRTQVHLNVQVAAGEVIVIGPLLTVESRTKGLLNRCPAHDSYFGRQDFVKDVSILNFPPGFTSSRFKFVAWWHENTRAVV